jgi:hypothetical protein
MQDQSVLAIRDRFREHYRLSCAKHLGRLVGRWEEEDSNLRRLSRRLYRPLPLATRASSRELC